MDELTWHKSTYSAEAANCLEIAPTPTTLHIRDSKNPAAPHLAVAPASWTEFTAYAVELSR